MKRSDIRKIIREEFVNELQLMSEAFADPIASKLNKLGGLDNRWKSFWQASANTYDIAWDKVPKGSFRKVANATQAKKGMAFYVVTTRKDNPYRSSQWSDRTIYPGVLAVAIDNKIQYFQEAGGTRYKRGQMKIGAKKTGYRSSSPSDAVGKGGRGMLMIKKLADLADKIYVFDLESYRGGTSALKSKRAEFKLGADTFSNHKKWKEANLARYKDMLASRVMGRDQVDRMVGEVVKIANETISNAMTLPKTDRHGELAATVNNKEVPLKQVIRKMDDVLDSYARYIRQENEDAAFLKKYPEYKADRPGRDDYGVKTKKEQALNIKKILGKFKSGTGLDRW